MIIKHFLTLHQTVTRINTEWRFYIRNKWCFKNPLERCLWTGSSFQVPKALGSVSWPETLWHLLRNRGGTGGELPTLWFVEQCQPPYQPTTVACLKWFPLLRREKVSKLHGPMWKSNCSTLSRNKFVRTGTVCLLQDFWPPLFAELFNSTTMKFGLF